MVDRPYSSANTNFRAAPDMSWGQLCLVWTFWAMHISIIYAFTQPDVSDSVVATFWCIAWGHGLVRAVFLVCEHQDINDASALNTNNPTYIRIMTDRPLPTMTVAVITNGLMLSVAIACFIAGFQVLGGLFLFTTYMYMSLYERRWNYHASIGY